MKYIKTRKAAVRQHDKQINKIQKEAIKIFEAHLAFIFLFLWE